MPSGIPTAFWGILNRKIVDRAAFQNDIIPMTAKAKAAINQFQTQQFALRDKVAARLAQITPNDRLNMMVSAGILTKGGKLTSTYRQKPVAA